MTGIHVFFYCTLAIVVLVWGMQWFYRKALIKSIAPIFYGSAVLVFAYLGYISYLQYQAFDSGVLGQVLKTGSGFVWFFSYVRLHFLNEYLLSLLGALVIWLIAEYFNKSRGEVLFEKEETYIGALGAFLVGYPGWLIYIPLVLLCAIVVSAAV